MVHNCVVCIKDLPIEYLRTSNPVFFNFNKNPIRTCNKSIISVLRSLSSSYTHERCLSNLCTESTTFNVSFASNGEDRPAWWFFLVDLVIICCVYVLVYTTQVNLTTNSPKCYASLGQLVNRPIMATSKASLKLLIDTKASRVLYAEAGKDFVDFLFSLLHLPVGTVIRLIKDSMVGSLGDLYESIENLSETYWQPNQNKESLLQSQTPPCASGVLMLLPSDISRAKMFYTCPNKCSNRSSYQLYDCDDSSSSYQLYVCDDSSTSCPGCNRSMSKEAAYVARTTANEVSAGKVGFVQGVVTYMVMDDLVVKPMSGISSITLLNKFNVKDLSALEEKVVDFGMDEGLKLLKASLQTKTVLTSIFLGNTGVQVE